MNMTWRVCEGRGTWAGRGNALMGHEGVAAPSITDKTNDARTDATRRGFSWFPVAATWDAFGYSHIT